MMNFELIRIKNLKLRIYLAIDLSTEG